MKLIVGLGNPGERYRTTRHNAGFWFADLLCDQHRGSFAYEKKFHGETVRVEIAGCDLRLLKPMQFMNQSGLAVQALCSYYQIEAGDILIVHDDLDLDPGRIKYKRGGGHGGHNGLRNLMAHIGGDFARLRVGVGHPGIREAVVPYVLHSPSTDERDAIVDAIEAGVAMIATLLSEGEQPAIHALHSRGVKPRPYKNLSGDDPPASG